MHKIFGEDQTCVSGDMLADRQTERQTDTVITIFWLRFTGGEVTTHTHTRIHAAVPVTAAVLTRPTCIALHGACQVYTCHGMGLRLP